MNSNDIAIKVENISKRYRIGLKEEIHENFLGALFDFMRSPLKNYRKYRALYKFDDINPDQHHNPGNNHSDIIWAVKDVSFEVNQGEVIGIIGRNGAGKSTLLKILTRIADPTSGYAEIRGRVSSLLEVGTGFHPELTGRENVYLNATILGMKKREVDDKFDEIVEFSGVEKFIDTPVKRYSSGMKVRLAFSVAAHLDPEILLIDEVLAVGDARFQKKCLNKMQDVGQQGRTVVFVSHNMAAITRLCPRAILLDQGGLLLDGPSHKAVTAYLSSDLGTTAAREWHDLDNAPGSDLVRLRAVRVRSEDGRVAEALDIRRPVALEMEYDVLKPCPPLMSHFHLDNSQGIRAFSVHDCDPDWQRCPRPAGRYVSMSRIPGNLLAEGMLYVHAGIISLEPLSTQCWVRDAVAFQVLDSLDGDSARGEWAREMGGVVRPLLQWSTHFTPL